ncbi:MAG: hypothetical protein HXX18_01625 [Bacteroidetes bacterium]|nr:hypothetical protein [Bacteroidota bacterium]
MNKQNIKAEITIVFKTCNLIDSDEFETKYLGNIENLLKEILENYPLIEIIDEECVILKIRKI